jgi:hypothetical protein
LVYCTGSVTLFITCCVTHFNVLNFNEQIIQAKSGSEQRKIWVFASIVALREKAQECDATKA